MKRFITLLILSFVVTAFCQAQNNEITAHMFSKSPLVKDATGQGTVRFGLTATPEQFDQIVKTLSEYPQKYVFKSEKTEGKPYVYHCTLTLLLDQGIPYLHKTFLLIGVQSFMLDGVKYPLEKMTSVLI